jgi:hypothetical protein
MSISNKKLDIKRFVGKNMDGSYQEVEFQYYRAGFFFYAAQDFYNAKWYMFPIPATDVGAASMNRKDKAITLMRWIRQAIEDNTFHEM